MTVGAGEPDIVVVGSASRDVVDDDPRGWRLGGGATYGALATARLGLRTAALIGVDAQAAAAHELDLLRAAGVDLRLARLERAPVFVNIERPEGRVQECLEPGEPLPVGALPAEWRSARAWMIAPVAGETDDGWADPLLDGSFVTVGWQGLLRDLEAGRTVRRRRPAPSRLVARADLVGVSEGDVPDDHALADLAAFLHPGATLVVTRGASGGHIVVVGPGRQPLDVADWAATPSEHPVDPTGAGDTFLAALAVGALRGGLDAGLDVAFAAAAASLVVEGPGLSAVPDRAAAIRRMADTAARGGGGHGTAG